ncbi:phage tail protein [Escherichia coli]|nr:MULTISPECIES: tail fiber protein [Escherichia]EFC4207690.1 phage tail protein [Escherichia coli]EGY0023554.1 phage tail protein [Escherichia coli]EJP6990924.1 tail fiber protein [Escherichia coli]EKQ0396225.1 tail fiber protein [Escherichia coli]EKQ6675653.1 tail fiber protein [Escherichia coli]
MTDAGRQELVNANKTGTNKVEIVSVGLGSRYYVTSTSQTNITNEIKRLTTIGGKVVSPDTIHVTAKDDSKDEYVVHTIGLYTNKGALFAVYSQEQAIINKASSTIALISSDIAIKTLDTKNITFGDIEFINPPATETVVGVARFANEQEIEAGTDDSLAVSAKRLKQAIVKHEQSRNHPDATLTSKGFVQLSSATNSASETLAATPKAVKAAYDLANAKYTAQDATTARKGIVQLSSATNSTSETLAATPKAVKAAYDLAAGKAPSNHTHSWEQITNVPVASLTVRGITQLSSATNSTSETLAATPKAVKAVMDETNKKAPLNSPALTGTPTTPTAPKGTNNTQIASTAYVMAAIAALVDSSPDALNTLNELAAALGNDPNFATTMTNALAGKQPKDATLTALAGLATAADRFPYFTGNDVASLATLTKVGRDILAKSTVAAVIEYLGLQETVNQASGALQKNQNGADIPDKRLFLRNIGATNSTTMSFSGGTGWFRLATVTMPQASSVVYISLIGGAGYNVNSPMQAGISELVLRAGNGNPKGLTGALWRRTSVGFTNFAWVNTSGDTYDVYVEIGNYATGVNIQWDYTSNASVTIHTSPTYTANKPKGLTDGTVYVIYSSHIKPTAADVGALSLSGGQLNGALGIGTSSALGGNSIVLGDNDTGFKQNGDGNLDVYANNVHVMRFVSGSIQSNKTINITGRVNPSDYGNFDSRYVKDVRLGTRVVQLMARGGRYEKAGHAITGLRIIGEVDGDDEAIFRPIQKYINGTWYNVAQV